MVPTLKPTIYLFTTTRVNLFKRDLLNVCCFPDGWQIKFGYKKAYIRETLLSNYQDSFLDHPFVIVFCEPIDQKADDLYYQYHPVRQGRILAAEKDLLDSLTLTLELGNVFDYFASNHTDRVQTFQGFVNSAEDHPWTKISDRLTKRPNRFIRSDSAHFPDDCWTQWARSWSPLVTYMGQRKGLDDSFFLRFASTPQAAANRRGNPFPESRPDSDGQRRRWSIAAGQSYNLRLELRAGTKAKHVPPKLTCRHDLVTSLGPFERQSGEGTETDFMIFTRRVFQTDFSIFVVRVEPDKEGKAVSSEFNGVLEIKAAVGVLVWTLLLLVGGTVLLSLDSALLDQLIGKAEGADPSWWNGKTVYWLAKALGAALVSVGGYLGFRKLPMKS